MKSSLVAIIMGSDSDLAVMNDAARVLAEFGVSFEMKILSAHRSPRLVHDYACSLVKRSVNVVIAGAGGAAHLAGVIASEFPLPVIGVPMQTPALHGVDSLYSIVQMPPGVPVATVGINAARNAALLAIQILAVADKTLLAKIQAYKEKLEAEVFSKDQTLQHVGWKKYGE